jgi:hypothetical protein
MDQHAERTMTARHDVLRDIHDLNAKERAQTFDRWVRLSKLVAPPRSDEPADAGDRARRSVPGA